MIGSKKNLTAMLMAALLAIFLGATPALADHKDSHQAAAAETAADSADDKKKGGGRDNDGDADNDSGTTYTEDNDTNDGDTPNNQSDDGDNAHPSGKDRSTENGGSGNQGNSESDPDDDGRGPDRSNGGPDKPNGSGGVDQADQDGNNGCGNDDDFEDDNEGHCGKPADKGKPSDKGKPDTVKAQDNKPCDEDATMPGVQKCDDDDGDDKVEGEQLPCDADATMDGTQPCEKDDKVKEGKITICHATGSNTNPFVEITVSVNGLNGHGDHEGDLIPMPANGTCAEDDVEGAVTPPAVDTDDSFPEGTTMVEGANECLTPEAVLGLVIENSLGGGDNPDNRAPSVLGAQVSPEKSGAVLPFTGGDVLGLLAVGLGMIALGLFAAKATKTASDRG